MGYGRGRTRFVRVLFTNSLFIYLLLYLTPGKWVMKFEELYKQIRSGLNLIVSTVSDHTYMSGHTYCGWYLG